MTSEDIRDSMSAWRDSSRPRWSRRRFLEGATLLALGVGVSPTASASRSAAPRAEAPPTERMIGTAGGQLRVVEQGTGPAVLFCHGFPDTAETWRSQMQAVASAGYRAVALDMRGYGLSLAPENPELYTAHHISGDLISVLDALSIEQAVIVGHDWGAYHSQLAALMRPDRFRALVSMSIPFAPRGDTDPWEMLRSHGLAETYYAFDLMKPDAEASFADATAAIPSILYWLSGSPDPSLRWNPVDPRLHMLRPSPIAVPRWADANYVRRTVAAFERTGFRGGLNYYRAFSKTFELTSALKGATIRQPSLYIWGDADGLSRMLHPRIPTLAELRRSQPNLVDQVVLKNVGHWVQHEASDRVNDVLISFLRNL